MNPREINATFTITTASINQHIALAKSNVRANCPALLYVHFEIEGDRVHVVTTDGRMQLHTETMATTALENQPDDDALCLVHLWKALRDITKTAADTACEAIWRHDDLPTPSGGAPEARKSRRQQGKPTPANS